MLDRDRSIFNWAEECNDIYSHSHALSFYEARIEGGERCQHTLREKIVGLATHNIIRVVVGTVKNNRCILFATISFLHPSQLHPCKLEVFNTFSSSSFK